MICLLESIISKLATSETYLFQLVSEAEQAGLGMTSSETPKTDGSVNVLCFVVRYFMSILVLQSS